MSAQAELGEESADIGIGPVRNLCPEGLHDWLITFEQSTRLIDLTDRDTGTQRRDALVRDEFAEQDVEEGGLACPVRARDENSIAPVDLRRDRTET